MLALQYLRYLGALPNDHLTALTLHKSVALCEVGKPSWIRDLQHVLAQLAPSVVLNHHNLSVPMISSLIANIEAICL